MTADELRPRAPDRMSRGALLALIAHGGLLVALTLGVSWRSSEPDGVEAELWAAVPQVAAPRAVQPTPTPPTPAPEPPKPPPPAPRAEEPPPPPLVNRDAEIAREKREQKEKLEKQRLEEERERAARDKLERERAKAEEARREAEQKKADAAKRAAEADQRKKAEAAEAARLAKLREDNLRRLNEQVSGSGAPDSGGTAAQSAGPSAGYAGRIKARIKPNIVFADEVAGNPLATVEVRVAADGTITGRRLVKSSGVAAWDDAVLRAIDKTETLPRDTDGRVPPSMLMEFRPRD